MAGYINYLAVKQMETALGETILGARHKRLSDYVLLLGRKLSRAKLKDRCLAVESFTLDRSTDDVYTQIARLLIDNGADVNTYSYKSDTTLFGSAVSRAPDIAKILMKAGATKVAFEHLRQYYIIGKELGMAFQFKEAEELLYNPEALSASVH